MATTTTSTTTTTEPSTSSSTSSLTTNLILEVNKSAQEFFRWSDNKINKLESLDLNFEQILEENENILILLKEKEEKLEEENFNRK